MKCDECGENKAKYICKNCGVRVCEQCYEMFEAQCRFCAPYFVEIKPKRKIKKEKK